MNKYFHVMSPGFRYNFGTLLSKENYLPRPCQNLTVEEVDEAKENFCDMTEFLFRIQCNIEDVFIQCG